MYQWYENSELMPNPNPLEEYYDAQQRIAWRVCLKVPYIALFVGCIFVVALEPGTSGYIYTCRSI